MRVYEEVAFVVDLFNDSVFEKLYWKAPEVLRSGVLHWGLRFLAHLAPGLAKPASLVKGLEVIDPATNFSKPDETVSRPNFRRRTRF